jgi:hypothetical protein
MHAIKRRLSAVLLSSALLPWLLQAGASLAAPIPVDEGQRPDGRRPTAISPPKPGSLPTRQPPDVEPRDPQGDCGQSVQCTTGPHPNVVPRPPGGIRQPLPTGLPDTLRPGVITPARPGQFQLLPPAVVEPRNPQGDCGQSVQCTTGPNPNIGPRPPGGVHLPLSPGLSYAPPPAPISPAGPRVAATPQPPVFHPYGDCGQNVQCTSGPRPNVVPRPPTGVHQPLPNRMPYTGVPAAVAPVRPGLAPLRQPPLAQRYGDCGNNLQCRAGQRPEAGLPRPPEGVRATASPRMRPIDATRCSTTCAPGTRQCATRCGAPGRPSPQRPDARVPPYVGPGSR